MFQFVLQNSVDIRSHLMNLAMYFYTEKMAKEIFCIYIYIYIYIYNLCTSFDYALRGDYNLRSEDVNCSQKNFIICLCCPPPTFTFNPTSYRQWCSRVQSECLFVAVHNSTSVTRRPDFYLVTSCFNKFDAHEELPSFVPLPIKLETAAVSKESAIIKHRRAKLSSFNCSHFLLL